MRAWTLAPLVVLIALAAGATPALALPSSFGTEGTGAGQISEEPRGVAVSQQSGDVFITDRNNQRIDRFGAGGEFKLAWGWGVADDTTDALQTCTATCFPGIEGSGSGQFSFPEGIAIDNNPLSGVSFEDVYVVDTRNHRVEKFSPGGEFILMFGGEVNETAVLAGGTEAEKNVCTAVSKDVCKAGNEEGTGNGEFQAPGGIAVDAAGTVYVGDRERVQKFSQEGAYEGQLTLTGAGIVTGLAVDSGKDLYVESTGVAGVRKFDEGGTEQGEARDGTGEASAIALGEAGELFVNDELGAHHILEYDSSGIQLASFDAGAEGGARGIGFGDGLGVLYVLNHGSVRVVAPPPAGPLVLSEFSEGIEPASATVKATLNPEGPDGATEASHYHFEYGTSEAYEQSTPEGELTGPPFEDQMGSAALTNLQPRTLYHFRVVVENAAKQVTDGPDRTFTTPPPVSIDGESVSQVFATSAQLEAVLDPHGLQTEYHFEYLTDAEFKANGESFTGAAKPVLAPSPPEAEGDAGSRTSDVVVALQVQGLSPGATYHYRVVAHNSLGAVEGEARTFTTQREEPSALPDGRAWELVSPPNKHGSPLEPLTEEGGVIQAAAGGGGLAYIAKGPIGIEPAGVRSPVYSQLLASRTPAGWATQDITTPYQSIAIVQSGHPSEYRLFSDDLSAGLVEPTGATRLDPGNPANTERTPYLRNDFAGSDPEDLCTASCYQPLVSSTAVPSGTKFGGIFNESNGSFTGGVQVVTATPDLSHVVLTSPDVLAPGFAPRFVPAEVPNLYELSGEKLQLISVLPSGEPAAEAGMSARVGGSSEEELRNAVSTDGNRVIFEMSNGSSGQHLYLRDVARGQTVQLDASQGGSHSEVPRPEFQGASADGSKVFFTDAARLTSDATSVDPGQPDLYECEISSGPGPLTCALSDLTVDSNPGESANVQGRVVAIDEAGRYVYFAANGALTPGATARECANESATCNLYVYDTVARQIKLVSVLSGADSPDWDAHVRFELGNLTARSSPNGHYLAFMSQRSLTGYDNEDATGYEKEESPAGSGEYINVEKEGRPVPAHDQEVYLYDTQVGGVRCVSCNPSGARPQGVFDRDAFPGLLVDHPRSWRSRWLAASIPGWTLVDNKQSLYQSRYLSNSGRMFFNAVDALVPEDTNGVEDVYEYELPQGEGQPASNSCTTASSTYDSASGGCVSLISSGTSKEESAFLDASENGDDVFFLTSSRLSPLDVDSAADVYDAHVCSAASPCPAPPPPAPPACQGDACQNPVASPSVAASGSFTFHGPGNLVSKPAVKAKAKPLTRAQKLAKALKTCRKKKKGSKRAACEKAARQKFRPLKTKKKGK